MYVGMYTVCRDVGYGRDVGMVCRDGCMDTVCRDVGMGCILYVGMYGYTVCRDVWM